MKFCLIEMGKRGWISLGAIPSSRRSSRAGSAVSKYALISISYAQQALHKNISIRWEQNRPRHYIPDHYELIGKKILLFVIVLSIITLLVIIEKP